MRNKKRRDILGVKMCYINSIISEKTEISKLIDQLQKDLNNLYDKYASANEDLFNMVDTDLMNLKYKVIRVNND